MKIKTAELTGAALDCAVGFAKLGRSHAFSESDIKLWAGVNQPSTNWSQGGPIVEREGMTLCCKRGDPFALLREFRGNGPTPLIAAMRCYVASKLGDEVEIPEELL